MNLLRTLVPAVLTGLALLVVPTVPAQAHAGLVSSSPEDGSILDAAPAEVALEFSEEVREPAFVVVTGPDGQAHEQGKPTLDGPAATQGVDLPETTAGQWTIAYRVVSADGHPITGHTKFRVKGPATSTLRPTPGVTSSPTDADADARADGNTGDEDERSNAPYFLAAVLAVLLVAVAAGAGRRRPQDPAAEQQTSNQTGDQPDDQAGEQ